ncbi:hypothetical protein KC19_2G080500 [Ceratodon purpureus]|uniref:Secreted protein n=1 Tax=Ceratodon purpureus TaxID=3225 RepID=A0A8T0IT14_CERPU|nr:hypothetical protein KC19_2G080500 [Ceratodon purpureus]
MTMKVRRNLVTLPQLLLLRTGVPCEHPRCTICWSRSLILSRRLKLQQRQLLIRNREVAENTTFGSNYHSIGVQA